MNDERFKTIEELTNNDLDESGKRYILKLGKFGMYVYDKVEDKDITLIDIVNLLNSFYKTIEGYKEWDKKDDEERE